MGKKVKVAVGSKSVPSLPFILFYVFSFLAYGGKVIL